MSERQTAGTAGNLIAIQLHSSLASRRFEFLTAALLRQAAVCLTKTGSLATNGYSSPATPVTATAAAVGMLQLFRCTHLDCLAVTAVAVCMV